MTSKHTSAILLMNLGSPDSTRVRDVRRYLNEFLMDERVIDLPWLARTLLVRGIIVPFRAPRSAEAYRSIWKEDGSPLIILTRQLQETVQARFEEPVEICMRYGNPSTGTVLAKLHRDHPSLKELILFPLYPHYAMSSYETAVEQVKDIHAKKKYGTSLKIVGPYYNDPTYIDALAKSIKPYLSGNWDKIVFSYHGVPERHIRKGDLTGKHCLQAEDCCHISCAAHAQCYRHQTMVTTALVSSALALDPQKVEQTFQSRLGRDPWLQPYTAARLALLPKEGKKNILVVCPAFVSDCLETLEEIAEEGKESFMRAGGQEFTTIPCLNVQADWVNAVCGFIRREMFIESNSH
jgi:protoporphyrin/coproporphyrin ferrochelatase